MEKISVSGLGIVQELIRSWALQKLEERCLVLDIESTGGSGQDEIIDIAIIDSVSLDTLYSSLIKPTTLLNYHAQKVHGIDYMMLRKAPYLEDEFSKINLILENKTVVTYNVAFDKRMFHQSYDKYMLDIPNNVSWECLMQKSTKFVGRQVKLDLMCAKFNIEKGTHRAESDALAAAKVLQSLTKI